MQSAGGGGENHAPEMRRSLHWKRALGKDRERVGLAPTGGPFAAHRTMAEVTEGLLVGLVPTGYDRVDARRRRAPTRLVVIGWSVTMTPPAANERVGCRRPPRRTAMLWGQRTLRRLRTRSSHVTHPPSRTSFRYTWLLRIRLFLWLNQLESRIQRNIFACGPLAPAASLHDRSGSRFLQRDAPFRRRTDSHRRFEGRTWFGAKNGAPLWKHPRHVRAGHVTSPSPEPVSIFNSQRWLGWTCLSSRWRGFFFFRSSWLRGNNGLPHRDLFSLYSHQKCDQNGATKWSCAACCETFQKLMEAAVCRALSAPSWPPSSRRRSPKSLNKSTAARNRNRRRKTVASWRHGVVAPFSWLSAKRALYDIDVQTTKIQFSKITIISKLGRNSVHIMQIRIFVFLV